MSTLDQIRQREAAAKSKKLADAVFGDVLRIGWCTYYFGADDKWHNARTGHWESATQLEREREAAGDDWEWLASRSDIPRLLATVDAVLALHSKRVEQAVFGDCAAEMCDHDDECPTEPFDVCAACWVAAEEVDQYFMEGQIHTAAYPCRTVRAITEALEGEQ